MIKIRLSRGGVRNNPVYRIVAIDERRGREGKPLEILGFWHPAKATKRIDKKRLAAWVEKGAKTTRAVDKLLR